jgi:hypothetical protein
MRVAELPVAAERAHTNLFGSANGRRARPLNQVLDAFGQREFRERGHR